MKLGAIISKAKTYKCKNRDLPVLSITQRDGFVLQSSHFKKEIASKDKSNYSIVKRNQLVQSIHIDEGGFSVQYIIDEGIVSPAYKIWNVDTSIVAPIYLNTFLRSKHSIAYFKSKLRGTIHRRGKIDDSDILGMEIPIPSITEQERIVAELDCLTGIIEKQKAQLKELDTLVQSIFYDMFGDPITNEKGWPVSTLLGISSGKLSYGSGASATEYDGKTRYIRITDIDDNGELRGEPASPNEVAEKYLLNEGDILFARTGATVGKTYLHKRNNGRCIYAGYLIRLIPDTSKVIPQFVFGFTKTQYYKSFVSLAQKAVAQPNINAEQYGNLAIVVPPLSLQQHFAEKIEAIEQQKANINAAIAETQKLFDYTMDKYFG